MPADHPNPDGRPAPTTAVGELLATVTAALPSGGEARAGQAAMAEAVAEAIGSGRHLVARAGTGTGKTLAYLLPAVAAGRRVVVATATRALQDQLAGSDLPLVQRALGDRRTVRFAVLKGRANYLCRQRAAEVAGHPSWTALVAAGDPTDAPAASDPDAPAGVAAELRRLLAWAMTSPTGDRSELPFEPRARSWATVSVGPRECPGAFRCPSGEACFAEAARQAAAEADVVVVNTALYTAHLAAERAVLPPHDLVVLDEAHEVEDIVGRGLGVELTEGRLRAAAATARPLVGPDGLSAVDGVAASAEQLQALLADGDERRVRTTGDTGGDGSLAWWLQVARGRVEEVARAVRRAGEADPAADDGPRRQRALLALGHLGDDLAALVDPDRDQVVWVAGSPAAGRSLRAAPVEVGPLLAARLWPEVTAVLTSATVPPGLAGRLGLPAQRTDHVDVGSPFRYRDHTLLYVATSLPDRRRPGADEAAWRELVALMEAAGGRTLALFTSWRAMGEAAAAVRPLVPFAVLAQGDAPKPALLRRFAEDEPTCLFATMSFWQGVDVPGRASVLVVIDRLPFPRPDDPVLQARRDRAGPEAFAAVDLPRAATLLAQGAGRLVRRADDRGVVAVLDPRLATAGYRRSLLQAMPPMRRTVDGELVRAFLRRLAAGQAPSADGVRQ